MARLVDTNVLLRSVQPSHPLHAVAARALERLLAQEEALYITVQNGAEFWRAARAQNGLGLSIDRAKEEIDRLEEFLRSSAKAAAPRRSGNGFCRASAL